MSRFLSETVDDVRTMARGWRWGRRSQVPRSAEAYVPPAQANVFDTDWARTPAARAVREVAQKGVLEPLLASQVRRHVEGVDVLDRVDGPVIFVANHASHLDTPLILLAAAGRVAPSYRRRRRGRLLLRHLVARGGLGCRCSTPSRSIAAAAPWRPRRGRCSTTAGTW